MLQSPSEGTAVAIEHQERNTEHESAGKPDIKSAVIRSTHKISLASLEKFLEEQGAQCIRIKGFVWLNDGKVAVIQSSFGVNKIHYTSNYNGPTEVIGMGYDLDSTVFSRIFK